MVVKVCIPTLERGNENNSLSNEEIAEPTGPEKAMVDLLLKNLNNYGYWQQEERNG